MYLFKSKYDDFDMKEFIDSLSDIMTEDTIIINIGTDRHIGDSLAPFVGTFLKENNFRLPVYGTVSEPVHALNIEKRLEEIYRKHPKSSVIGIDATLGYVGDIGKILIDDSPISPGAGVGKTLPKVGKYSIKGIVDDSDNNELFTNRTVRLDRILSMAKKISEGLIKASQYIEVNEVASDNSDDEIKLFRAC